MGVNGEEQTSVTNKVPTLTITDQDGVSKPVDNPNIEINMGEVTINVSKNNGNTHEMVVNINNKENPILPKQPTMRIFSKADPDFSLAVRDGNVILATSNHLDLSQHWSKYENTEVKDEQGNPSFALVNKATGLAIKHSIGGGRGPVQLMVYNPKKLDESILWTQSKPLSGSYRIIRIFNNIQLVFDALNGIKKDGGVRDGTKIVLWEWAWAGNQLWKFDPYTDKEDEKTIINIPNITKTEDGAPTPVDDSVLKLTIRGVTVHLSNNGNNPKMVIGIDGSDGKGTRDNEGSGTKDDAIITKMGEQINSLQEQNKSLQEQVNKILQEKDSKEGALEKQINEAAYGGSDKLYYSHTSGSSIQLDSGKYKIVCPYCNYIAGMAYNRPGYDPYNAVVAIIGRGLHVDEDGNQSIIHGTAVYATPQSYDCNVVGKTVSQRGPPLFGLNVHCPDCAWWIGIDGDRSEIAVKAGKHNHPV